ncbi:hypothetical protein DB32_005245 [Sandaracinus amylolyticus]|uniref:Uncharacterized protein n=1 Tax=Sandaracinus amylolyticus TaxID=927083 RepID=A0A0F6W5X5_9BACT|nr:hypothetical protein DB32_005245 [Sandaracinus amylolyticus]
MSESLAHNLMSELGARCVCQSEIGALRSRVIRDAAPLP